MTALAEPEPDLGADTGDRSTGAAGPSTADAAWVEALLRSGTIQLCDAPWRGC